VIRTPGYAANLSLSAGYVDVVIALHYFMIYTGAVLDKQSLKPTTGLFAQEYILSREITGLASALDC